MASYFDQIPKQLAARRKAFRAARGNPALLPSCWAIVRSIGNNMYEYMRNSVIGGCTFPDRPIHLSSDDATFLNFGVTPALLMQDAAWSEAEKAKQPPPSLDAAPSEEGARLMRRKLAALGRLFGVNHRINRVYNLEAWLQDMYRDKLDVDFAEDLQRRIDALNAHMGSVPKAIAATGLDARLSKGVLDAFDLFKTVTGSSHQLDREKMSFVDRRSYVNTIQKIELIMAKADESLGASVAGRSVVREQFALWKEASYEMMGLTRQLRVLWAGTSLDERIQELSDLLTAIQKTINRCSEEALVPEPQLPLFRSDFDSDGMVDMEEIADAFHSLTLHDPIAGGNAGPQVREIRKFGPLAVTVTPGMGEPRYSWEGRKAAAGDEDDTRRRARDTTVIPTEREMDVDRRVRYPLNCLVVPVGARRETFRRDLADAWLEYHQWAFPTLFKEFLEAARSAAPEAFAPPADAGGGELPPTYMRRMLARQIAAFAAWARDGRDPGEDAPGFEAFREVVLERLDSGAYLIPARYRPLVQLFSEAGPKRRLEMWRRFLGPRFALDRQLVAVYVLMKDWNGLRNSLKFLPSDLTRNNSFLANGFARANDAGDPFAGHKAVGFFRKFLLEQPDLKAALMAVESRVTIEVETLRGQSESLGRVFQYDQASEAMLRSQASQIQEKRLAANAHIDHYLTGLMYAHDGNLDAAERTLVMCVMPAARRAVDWIASPEVPEEIGGEWFAERLRPREGKFETRRVAGEDAPGAVCDDQLYYNLGLVYFRQERYIEAAMCFRGERERTLPERAHLARLWAAEHQAFARARLPKEAESEPLPAESA